MVDILRSLKIKPDYIIGHSSGELACAYADECFTTEQAILSAYTRGAVSVETKFIPGIMAAVGIGYKNLKNMCPADIVVACHNSADSATISGPAESMSGFIDELKVSISLFNHHSLFFTVRINVTNFSFRQKKSLFEKFRAAKYLITVTT